MMNSDKGKGKSGKKSPQQLTGAMKRLEHEKLLEETMHTNLNTVDSILMASAVMINLGALLYDAGEQSEGEQGAERTLITTIIVMVLVGSLLYCFGAISIAVLAEMSPGTCKKPKAAAARKAAMASASNRRKDADELLGGSGAGGADSSGSAKQDSSVMMSNPLRAAVSPLHTRQRSNSMMSDGTDEDAGVGMNAMLAAKRRKELAAKKHKLDDLELNASMMPGDAPPHRLFSQFSEHLKKMQDETAKVQANLRAVRRQGETELDGDGRLSVAGSMDGSVSPSRSPTRARM